MYFLTHLSSSLLPFFHFHQTRTIHTALSDHLQMPQTDIQVSSLQHTDYRTDPISSSMVFHFLFATFLPSHLQEGCIRVSSALLRYIQLELPILHFVWNSCFLCCRNVRRLQYCLHFRDLVYLFPVHPILVYLSPDHLFLVCLFLVCLFLVCLFLDPMSALFHRFSKHHMSLSAECFQHLS